MQSTAYTETILARLILYGNTIPESPVIKTPTLTEILISSSCAVCVRFLRFAINPCAFLNIIYINEVTIDSTKSISISYAPTYVYIRKTSPPTITAPPTHAASSTRFSLFLKRVYIQNNSAATRYFVSTALPADVISAIESTVIPRYAILLSKQEAKKATPNGKSPKTDARPAKSNSILIPTSLTDGARSISVFRCLFTAG